MPSKKKVWEDVGGFPDFRAAEDKIFMKRIERNGYKIGYAPGATVYWEIPSDFRSTFKRFNEFSYHDIIAGRAKDWHYPVIRILLVSVLTITIDIAMFAGTLRWLWMNKVRFRKKSD